MEEERGNADLFYCTMFQLIFVSVYQPLQKTENFPLELFHNSSILGLTQ
jgi:hypothetical protein